MLSHEIAMALLYVYRLYTQQNPHNKGDIVETGNRLYYID